MSRRCPSLLGVTLLWSAAAFAERDADLGEALYAARCGACHAVDDNGPGPMHRGVVGCRAGTQPGYDYSPALSAADLIWTATTLDQWLENPDALVPGNHMRVRLAADADDRANLIAYLQRISQTPGRCQPAH
ncbi:c-type cytochrome [Flagellatimonas centrodinii]|uniref:c-type cytochrome n=1 Tax=Flagellatimonas centrodinii TaxID=2806210 RepID=UPI001FED5573|nr:c-type cytochrome [Flagellatimonas centrodinii]ULQ45294.1 c-type cytochrome [Flagellatimonas centrodinii]